MLGKFLEGASGKLADQLAAFTPALVFWSAGLAAYVSSRGWQPTEAAFRALPESLQVAALVVGALVVTTTAALLRWIELPVLRALEGYRPRWLKWTNGLLLRWHRRRWDQLATRYQQLTAPGASSQDEAERLELEVSRRDYPPTVAQVMPTALGNVLRAAELRPQSKYGLDAVICWPRLWLVMPEGSRAELAAARRALDTCAAVFVLGACSAVFAVWSRWALVVAVVVPLASYVVMISAARVYGTLLEAAFDVHRAALYRALRWPLPPDAGAEPEAGAELTEYLWRGSHAPSVKLLDAKE